MLRIGIVVGEPSGDALGAGLVRELRNLKSDVHVEGILGPKLMAEGGVSHFPMNMLSVMGITEVAGKYLELASIRNRLKHIYLRQPPDIFIGIDSPDFNLGLEQSLKNAGIKTVHYVSPSVWAWRQGRIHTVERATNLLLTLFPFESNYYSNSNVKLCCVGHPLANTIQLVTDTDSAKKNLNVEVDRKLIAIMPGSRGREIDSLSPKFLQSAASLYANDNKVGFVSSFIDSTSKEKFEAYVKQYAPNIPMSIYIDRSHESLMACDAALVASGTITLEAMLYKKPMVICYITSYLTHLILRKMVRSNWIGLPNILAQREVVPELIQSDVTVENIINNLSNMIYDESYRQDIYDQFYMMHQEMNLDTDKRAAKAVLSLV